VNLRLELGLQEKIEPRKDSQETARGPESRVFLLSPFRKEESDPEAADDDRNWQGGGKSANT